MIRALTRSVLPFILILLIGILGPLEAGEELKEVTFTVEGMT